MHIITIVQLFYGVPSLALMIFFFFLPMFARKTLNNPFYRLLQIDLLVNILCYLNTWIALRLEKEAFGNNLLVFLERLVPGTVTTSCFLCLAFFHMQNITGLSLAVYRLTSVHFFKSEHYWKKLYPLVPVFGVLYNFVILAPWWSSGWFVTRATVVGDRIHKNLDMRALILLCSFDPIFAVFYFLLVMLMGVWTTTVVMHRWKMNQSKRFSKFLKKATKIVFCNSFLMSGNLLFLIVHSCLVLISKYRQFAFKYSNLVVTFTSDLFTLAMPYILLAFDSNIRRKLGMERESRSEQYSVRTITNQSPVN